MQPSGPLKDRAPVILILPPSAVGQVLYALSPFGERPYRGVMFRQVPVSSMKTACSGESRMSSKKYPVHFVISEFFFGSRKVFFSAYSEPFQGFMHGGHTDFYGELILKAAAYLFK